MGCTWNSATSQLELPELALFEQGEARSLCLCSRHENQTIKSFAYVDYLDYLYEVRILDHAVVYTQFNHSQVINSRR